MPANTAKSWLLAARPKTLPAAVVPVWMGNVTLLGNPTFSWQLFFSTLFSCLCIQIATNFFNDAIDFDKGADTKNRLGPVRATASGLLSRRVVFAAALGFCALAALIALPMIHARGWPIILIGVVSLLLAYGYTGGPVPLAYRGLGEIFVILFFGFVAVLGSFWVQSGQWPPPQTLWILAGQTGFFSTVLIAINNLRDIDEDSLTGKRTLAVRFGKTFARWEIAVFCFMPIFLLTTFGKPGWLSIVPLMLLAVPVVIGIFRHEPSRFYNRLLALAGLQLLVFAAVVTLLFWPK